MLHDLSLLRSVRTLACAALLQAGAAQGATYTVDQSHTNVGFQVRHLVSKTKGEFRDFAGTFSYDPKNLAACAASVTAQAASINTNDAKRDEHLRGVDFFDVKKFPTLTFASTSCTPVSAESFTLAGNLTMHGVTKPVSFAVAFNGEGKDPWGATRAGFTAKTTVNRKDFGLTYNKALDTGGLLIGDDVEITLELEGVAAASKTKG